MKETFAYRQTAATLFRQVGVRRFTGNTKAYGAPTFRDYLYGPDIVTTGVIVDGRRIEFKQRSANFVDVTISTELGSCPYLLSYGPEGWIDHGKVLHRARTRSRASTQVISFAGIVSRFRLEEREPETAYFDQAELVLVLKDRSTIRLKPEAKALSDTDQDYVALNWGEALDLTFALPPTSAADDVVETRLLLSGYYDRYSDQIGARQQQTPVSLTVRDRQ